MYQIFIFIVLYSFISVAQSDTNIKQNANDFDLIDLNADSLISYSEFEKWYHSLFNSSTEMYRFFASYDFNNDNHLTVSEFVPLAFALSQQSIKGEENFFMRLDLNGDNVLTRAEIQRADKQISEEIINSFFQFLDTNLDGQITYREYEIVTNGLLSHKQISTDRSGLAQSLMAAIDLDHNKLISKDELATYNSQFNFNKVSQLEINYVFAQLDKNQDNFLTLLELKELPEEIIKTVGIRPMPNIGK